MKTKTFLFAMILVFGLSAPALSQTASSAEMKNAGRKGVSMPDTYSSMMESNLVNFLFVINRGEVFAAGGLGELSSLSLWGYRTEAFSVNPVKGAMNGSACLNRTTLTGVTSLNDYSAQPSTEVTASLFLQPLSAPTGLHLTLTVDGASYDVELPFVTEDFRWKAGFSYRYTVTLNGGTLQVTGMKVERTK